jgi:hypothetical protein
MRSFLLCLIFVGVTAPAYTQTTPPAAPSVTAGADFKGLRFDWETVPGAAWYQFEKLVRQTGNFVQDGPNYPATRTTIRFRVPVHLFDWTYSRYRVAACNSAGCTRSNEVSVSDLRRDAVGYFKRANRVEGTRFGADTDISPDGVNFVAGAPGDVRPQLNQDHITGAAHVFRRAPNGTWSERVRLLPEIPAAVWGENVTKVAISADGDTVVLGLPHYRRVASDSEDKSGEVYVFHNTTFGWTSTRLYSGTRGAFGSWVGINDAGDTIAVATSAPSVSAPTTRTAIYKLIDGQWKSVRGIASWKGYTEECYGGALSRDGSTVAESCSVRHPGETSYRDVIRTYSGANWSVREDVPLGFDGESPPHSASHSAIAIDSTGNTIAAQIRENPNPSYLGGRAEVQVYSRAGGAYAKTASFTSGPWRNPEDKALFGLGLAMSGDGGTIAIGDPNDDGVGTGPRAPPLSPNGEPYGGVYIYRLKAHWVLGNIIKPNYQPAITEDFGRELALNFNGQTLLVGNPNESNNASGIGGDWSNYDSTPDQTGAVFMY